MTNFLTGAGWRDIHLKADCHGLFLVVISIAGRKYCFATKRVEVREQCDDLSVTDHRWLQFIPALLESPSFKIEVDPYDKKFNKSTFNFRVNGNYFPIRNFRTLGINFQAVVVDVYWYITNCDFALRNAYHILQSTLSSWNFDEEENFIEFSVVDMQFEGDLMFPPGIINSVSFPTANPESAGKRYPVVIGTAYKVPAHEISNGAFTDFLFLDDGWGEFISSSPASIAYKGDEVVAISSQNSGIDGIGRKYNYVTFSPALDSKDVTVDVVGHSPSDLASVIRYLFSAYSAYSDFFDTNTLLRIANEFSPIDLSLVFNDDTGNGVIHVIRERLLKQFPLLMYQDKKRMMFQHLLWTRDVTKVLSFDKNIYRMTNKVSETPRENVYNSYNLNYGTSGLRGDALGSIQRNKDNDAICFLSELRYGKTQSKNLDVPDVINMEGGLFVLNWSVETYSKMRVKVSYHVSFDAVNVQIWDTVRVYDKYQGWTYGPYFKVIGIEYREEKGLFLDLISLDDFYDVYAVNKTAAIARSLAYVDEPFLLSATAQADGHTARLVFNEDMNETKMETEAYYSVSGLTVSSAIHVNAYTVDITFVEELLESEVYLIQCTDGLTDIFGNVIHPGHREASFTGYGIPPEVASASQTAFSKVQVVFDEDMNEVDGSLDDPDNYHITGDTTVTVTGASIIDAQTVELTITEELFIGGDYVVDVTPNVKDIYGNFLNNLHRSAAFVGTIGTLPEVSSANQVVGYKDRITVVFSESMTNNADLTDASNYTVSGASSPGVSSVSYVSPTTVTLILLANLIDGVHNVAVADVIDLAGNPLDLAHDDASFTADVTSPRVSSMTFDNSTHNYLFVNFNEDMTNNAALILASNYPLSGGLTVSSVTRISATQVRLNLSGNITVDDTYTVGPVINVTDLLGNVIDAAFDEASCVVDVEPPQVVAIGLYDTLHFWLTFDKDMLNNADLVNSANYEWSPHYTTLYVSRIDARTIHLTPGVAIGDEPWIEIFVLNTTGGIQNTLTHVLDPAHDSAGFELDRVRPTMLSAAFVDTTHIDVTFDKTMDPTTTGDAAHYGVTGGGAPSVSSVTKQTDYVWRLNLGSAMTEGTLTVDAKPAGASHITDNHGNLLDEYHDEASFDYDISGPQLSSVAIIDHGHLPDWTEIELTFNELLKNEAAITTLTNYEITGPARGWATFNPDAAHFGATHDKVHLRIDKKLCLGEDYTVLAMNLHDDDDNDLDTDHDEAIFTDVNGYKIGMLDDGGDGSEVPDVYTINMMFSEDIKYGGVAGDFSVQVFPGGAFLTIGYVANPASDVAQLQLVDPMTEGQDYLVTVTNNSVHDFAGNYVDPTADQQIIGCPVF